MEKGHVNPSRDVWWFKSIKNNNKTFMTDSISNGSFSIQQHKSEKIYIHNLLRICNLHFGITWSPNEPSFESSKNIIKPK
jgi:hypothetical protein